VTKEAKAAGPKKEGPAASAPQNGQPDEQPELSDEESKKAEGAIAEAEGKERVISHQVGKADPITLTLPADLRASVVGRASVIRDQDIAEALKLCKSVVGVEQYEQVLNYWDDQELTANSEEFGNAVGNLLRDSLVAYGLTPGESEASPDS
jgi:hypothetical protein